MESIEAALTARENPFGHAIIPIAETKVCVVVPVRDEAVGLKYTLDALRRQIDAEGLPLDHHLYEVLVLVNNCRDDSHQICLDYMQKFPAFRLIVGQIWLENELANIGTVRRMLMDEACQRLSCAGKTDGIIASTDGDTIVDEQWIINIIEEIGKGNDAVGGRILTKPETGRSRFYHLRDVTYRCLLTQAESLIDPQQHDPFPCHFQYFGANMAVTCKMYELAGRLPQVPYLEDMAFYKALVLHDARIRRSFAVRVYTSARTEGRVSIGFSEQLKRWMHEHNDNIPQMVEDVMPSLAMFYMRGFLRKCWDEYKKMGSVEKGALEAISASLNLSEEWLLAQLENTNYFGVLWDAVSQSQSDKHQRLQPIHQAIDALRVFIKNPCTSSFQTNPADKSLHFYEVNV
jgi:hypothetical protein